MTLPCIELHVAVDGERCEKAGNLHDVELRQVTHVQFLRDSLTFDDLIVLMQAVGDLSDLAESPVKALQVVRVLLPRMTNLTDKQVGALAAKDALHMVEVMTPFLDL